MPSLPKTWNIQIAHLLMFIVNGGLRREAKYFAEVDQSSKHSHFCFSLIK